MVDEDNIKQMLQKLKPLFKYSNYVDIRPWWWEENYNLEIKLNYGEVVFKYRTINQNIERHGYAYIMKRAIKKYKNMQKNLSKYEKKRQKRNKKKNNAKQKVNIQFKKIMQEKLYCPYCGETECGCGL